MPSMSSMSSSSTHTFTPAASFSAGPLLPALLQAVLAATPARRSAATALLLAAITLSGLGDITLLVASDFFFVLGLSLFVIAWGVVSGQCRGNGATAPVLPPVARG